MGHFGGRDERGMEFGAARTNTCRERTHGLSNFKCASGMEMQILRVARVPATEQDTLCRLETH